MGAKYGIPVINKRLAISPAATLLAGHGHAAALQVAKTLDAAAAECRVDFVGGFTALVHKGISAGDAVVMESLPEVLSQTQAGLRLGQRGLAAGGHQHGRHPPDGPRRCCEIAAATAAQRGFGCAKLVIFANIPEDNPFMAGAYLGAGEPEAAVNIGVSGPGVVCSALRRRLAMGERLTLGDLAEEIKITSFRVTRVGELIGREVAAELGIPFGIVDLSLAPTPTVGDSVGEILKTLGIARHRRARLDRRRGHAQRRREEGRPVRLQLRRRPERGVHSRQRGRRPGRRRRAGPPGPGKTRGHDQRLLGRPGHDRHSRRHAGRRRSPPSSPTRWPSA